MRPSRHAPPAGRGALIAAAGASPARASRGPSGGEARVRRRRPSRPETGGGHPAERPPRAPPGQTGGLGTAHRLTCPLPTAPWSPASPSLDRRRAVAHLLARRRGCCRVAHGRAGSRQTAGGASNTADLLPPCCRTTSASAISLRLSTGRTPRMRSLAQPFSEHDSGEDLEGGNLAAVGQG